MTSRLADFVDRWSLKAPARVALIDESRSVTYGELRESSNRIGNALLGAGIAPGSRIGYVGKNSAAFFEIWLGANKTGSAIVPLNWRSSRVELSALIADAALDVLFVGDPFAELVSDALESCCQRLLVVLEADLTHWSSTGAAVDPNVPTVADSAALLAYTSGTTALPKGVQVTNRAFAEWFRTAADEPAARCTADDVGLMVMPNFHLAGTWVSLPVLHDGGTLVITPAFEPGLFTRTVQKHRVTVTCLVPTALRLLLDHLATAESTDLSSLRRVLYAGSPMDAETLRALIEELGCDLVQFYGTTETFIITLLRPDQHLAGEPSVLLSCGTPMPGVDVRLVDARGADVDGGHAGEVLVRSPWMFESYWNNVDATAAAFIAGWYRTGDIGVRDARGNIRLVDRLKDMIVTGGENVYSVEVERAILAHDGVASVAVVGQPDAKWGERVVAFVVPSVEGLAAEELASHCRELIAGYKVPKAIHIVDELPLTASGKIRKEELREQLRAQQRIDDGTFDVVSVGTDTQVEEHI